MDSSIIKTVDHYNGAKTLLEAFENKKATHAENNGKRHIIKKPKKEDQPFDFLKESPVKKARKERKGKMIGYRYFPKPQRTE